MKDLNLVPKSYILQKKKRTKRLYYGLLGVIIVIFFAVFITIPVLIKHNLQKRLEVLEMYIKETNRYIEIEEQLLVLKILCGQREDEAKRLSKLGMDIVTVMERVEKCAPEKLFILSFNVSSNQNGSVEISLNGISESEDEIATFANYLRKDGYFSNVDIKAVNKVLTLDSAKGTEISQNVGSSNKEHGKSYNFDIKLNLEAGK